MKTLIKIILITIISSSLFSAKIELPTERYKASGSVTDIFYKNKKLYVATDNGCVDIIDVTTKKILQTLEVSKIKDFMGDVVDSKILSIDILNNNILVLSQGEHGYSRVDMFTNNKISNIITVKDKISIAKSKFLNDYTIILGLLSNDIISYNIKTKKKNWVTQASQSKFSNFVLNEDKSEIVVSDESGNLQIFKTKDATHIKTLSGENLDNVFQVDYKNGIIATAGKDRRVVIYDGNSAYYKSADFFIYSVGLSPSAKLVGYASDEQNNVTIFKTATKTVVGIYGSNKMTISNILFINEKEFFVSSDNRIINFYKIK